ncbi:3'-5' exonuclease family protein [Propionivibrio sp.]|uniref:3'-5' exonuclease family protein n=1 Tax=Propionivibrio sp. TaxID=2212460 RepID=UPI0025F61969|nr:3'-5' exonuclease family protein [Propionivibrio sp.]MBK8400980.1 3'-5' exoribonuclease [Propionivibrio sp.]MBK8894266.1 3'-5' exoribonuclease [Propionivibrio sp.]MBL0207610.1 3'-5' exoribonuclease [Propionivibrio sp.]
MDFPYVREPLLFVDLETTGANFATDRIIEIGFVEVDQQGVREWSSLVNPGMPVSDFITGLTGISTAMVSSSPEFETLVPIILEKLRGRLLVAHNARFDYTFLKREFKRLGVEFRMPNLCTVKLSRKLFPQHHRHNLDSLVERHDIAAGDRHRALADARILWKLWQCWHESLPSEDIHSAIDVISGCPELPPQIDATLIEDLPESPGAYALYAEDGSVLVVKRSANIRQQVLKHFAVTKRDTALWRDIRLVKWRESAGELGARLNELELGSAAPGPADELCSWQLVEHGKGDFRPQLVFADKVDFARANDLFGLYRNRREAGVALRKLADVHNLCPKLIGLEEGASGEACRAVKHKSCRGGCCGQEKLSLHSARLMTALAKFRLNRWPYEGPVALVEWDKFGLRADYHLIDNWRYLGTVHDEAALHECLLNRRETAFAPEIYRIINKHLKAGKVRVLPLFRPTLS